MLENHHYKLNFVDTHVHFYDMQHPELVYAHWQPGVPHPFIGAQIQKLSERNYLAEDYVHETRNSNVTKAVHVQAAMGSPNPVEETIWLQESAIRTGFPQAIVAHANLKDPHVEGILERHCSYANMRGIRDFSYGDYLLDHDFHRGFRLLEKYNLVSSVGVQWDEMTKLRNLAKMFPNINIVIDHCGFPSERNTEYFDIWRRSMITAAEASNVICKISGLGMGDNKWTVESIKPYVLHCIETFGVERCIFGTNWPIDWLWSTYDAVISAYIEITENFNEEERISMFSRNAEQLYNI